jgi:hypothetical protein
VWSTSSINDDNWKYWIGFSWNTKEEQGEEEAAITKWTTLGRRKTNICFLFWGWYAFFHSSFVFYYNSLVDHGYRWFQFCHFDNQKKSTYWLWQDMMWIAFIEHKCKLFRSSRNTIDSKIRIGSRRQLDDDAKINRKSKMYVFFKLRKKSGETSDEKYEGTPRPAIIYSFPWLLVSLCFCLFPSLSLFRLLVRSLAVSLSLSVCLSLSLSLSLSVPSAHERFCQPHDDNDRKRKMIVFIAVFFQRTNEMHACAWAQDTKPIT